MWKIIDDAIAVSPWITENNLKCAAIIHKQEISNNKLIDKEEAETDKIDRQPSVLGLIYNTAFNGRRPKVSALKNKKNLQERMDESKLRITHFSLEEKKNFKRLPKGTFHLLQKHVITKYDLHEKSFSIPVDTIKGREKYLTTALKPGPLDVAYQIEPIILRYIEMNQDCGQTMTWLDVINCENSLITGSTLVTTMNRFRHSNSKSPAR